MNVHPFIPSRKPVHEHDILLACRTWSNEEGKKALRNIPVACSGPDRSPIYFLLSPPTQSSLHPSSLPNLHHLLDRLSANRTNFDLLSTLNTGAHMPAVIEQGIHPLTVADLAHLPFIVGDLPVRGSLTPALALVMATLVFVARSLLDKDALAVVLVVSPAAGVGIAVRVDAGAFGVGFARGTGAG